MAITLETLIPYNGANDPESSRVDIDVENFDDPIVMLKQDDDWILLDDKQLRQLRDFIDSRLTR